MKAIHKLAQALGIVLAVTLWLNAREWDSSNKMNLGIYTHTGAMMGGGLECGFALYQGKILQLRNTISIESKATKLMRNNAFDSNILGLYEKLSLGVFGGGSISSHIGFPYFRPYLFIGGGFGLVYTPLSSFSHPPYYWEISGGLGHEFITTGGNGVFFELGGGVAILTQILINQHADAPIGGMFKVLLGYRYFF